MNAQKMLEEPRYRELAREALHRVESAFDEVDLEDADVESSGDVVNITFRGGSRCVVNTQGPTRQLWLAGAGRGWHFSWDEDSGRWLDDRGAGEELFAVLTRISRDAIGFEPAF